MMPNTMASWVRTPDSGHEVGRLKLKPEILPTLPLIFDGAISARKIGPVHRPIPAPQPVRNLDASE